LKYGEQYCNIEKLQLSFDCPEMMHQSQIVMNKKTQKGYWIKILAGDKYGSAPNIIGAEPYLK